MNVIRIVRQSFAVAALIATAGLASGCAELTHYTKNTDAKTKGGLVLIDAKQRAILTGMVKKDASAYNNLVNIPSFCAEPSPDALSALSASTGFSLDTEKVNSALRTAIAENAGSIGLRTQSIQLMRDAMYRICELSISGTLDGFAAETLHRRFQQSMVAILAIEQLTGTVRAPTVTLTGQSASGTAEELIKVTEKLDQARKSLKKAEEALADKNEKLTKQNETVECLEGKTTGCQKKSDQEIGAAKDEQKKIEDEVATLKKDHEAKKTVVEKLERMHADLSAGNALASGKAEIEDSQCCKPDAEAIKKISDVVDQIVRRTFELRFSDDLCTTVLLHPSEYGKEFNAYRASLANFADADEVAKSGNVLVKCLELVTNRSTHEKAITKEIEDRKMRADKWDERFSNALDKQEFEKAKQIKELLIGILSPCGRSDGQGASAQGCPRAGDPVYKPFGPPKPEG